MAANIKIIGVGKGGSFLASKLKLGAFKNAACCAVSTNKTDLESVSIGEKMLISADPEAAQLQIASIKRSIEGYSTIILLAQFGGDKSAHLTAAFAKIAKTMNIGRLAVCAIANKIDDYSRASLARLRENCENLLCLPNDLSVGEIFRQNDIMKSFQYVQTIPPQKVAPEVRKASFMSKITRAKPKDIPPVEQKSQTPKAASGENLAQDEFPFVSLSEQRGFFGDTKRNFYNGEDLDIPTYLRRNLKIIV